MLSSFMKDLLDDTSGATAIEYGLVAALITIGMLAALQGLATTTTEMWDDTSERVDTAIDF
jgi:pilus assembly protein Flp/PilA